MLLVVPKAVAQISTAESEVNLQLEQILSVEISQSSVSIPMNTPAHYLQGSSSQEITNHLQVSATSSYVLRVRTEDEYFNLDAGLSTLPVSTVRLNLTDNGATGVTVLTPVSLSNSDTDVASSGANEIVQYYNAVYEIPQSQTQSYINKEDGNYTTTVIYTIVPQ
jgi:hypothetical protein